MISRIPVRTSASMMNWRMGLSAMASMALGRASVNGRSLCPSPAVSITACFIARPLKYLRPRLDNAAGYCPGADEGVISDPRADVDAGVNAGLHAIADDSAELPAPGIHAIHADIALVQPQVGDFGP